MSAREEQLLLRARLRCLAKGQGRAGVGRVHRAFAPRLYYY